MPFQKSSPLVVLVDEPLALASETSRLVPWVSDPIDARRWQSFQLNVQYEAANTGPPANTGLITLEWGDTSTFTNLLQRHSYEINSKNSTDCGPTVISDGMYGPWLRFGTGAGAGAASTMSLTLYGSNRPAQRPRIAEIGAVTANGISTDRVLCRHVAAVAANTTVYRNVRLGAGAAVLHVATGAAGGPWDLHLFTPSGGVNDGRVWSVRGHPALGEITPRLALPRRVLTLRIINTHATVAGSCDITLIAEDN